MRLLPTLLVAGSLAVLIPGCGSSDKKSGDSGARGYANTGQALDKICAGANTRAGTLGRSLTSDAKHDAPILDRLVKVVEDTESQMRQVTPNEKLKATFDKYVSLVHDGVQEFRDLRDAAKTGDDTAYNAAKLKLLREHQPSKPLEKALGANGCAKTG